MLKEQGRYRGDVAEGVFTQSKNGSPCMAIKLVLEDGDERVVYLYMTDKAMSYTQDKLNKLGFDGNFDSPAFTNGTGVELTCKHEEFEGKVREKWDLAGGMPAAAGADLARQYQARWRANNSAPSRPAGRAVTPPARPAPPAPPAPAPMPPPAPMPVAVAEPGSAATNMQEAWDVWCASAKDGTPDNAAWQKACAKIAADHKVIYTKFGPAEWEAVALLAEIPF